jgi:hypothetical protein
VGIGHRRLPRHAGGVVRTALPRALSVAGGPGGLDRRTDKPPCRLAYAVTSATQAVPRWWLGDMVKRRRHTFPVHLSGAGGGRRLDTALRRSAGAVAQRRRGRRGGRAGRHDAGRVGDAARAGQQPDLRSSVREPTRPGQDTFAAPEAVSSSRRARPARGVRPGHWPAGDRLDRSELARPHAGPAVRATMNAATLGCRQFPPMVRSMGARALRFHAASAKATRCVAGGYGPNKAAPQCCLVDGRRADADAQSSCCS